MDYKQENGSFPFVKEIRRTSEHITIVRLYGAMDLNAMPPIEKTMRAHRSYMGQNVVLDFTEVVRIDTATLAVLIYVINQLKQHHSKLCLIQINDNVREHIRIAKLEPLIHVYDTLEGAIQDLNE